MAVTRKELLGAGVVAGALAHGAAPAAPAHGDDEDIVGSRTGTVTATDPPLQQAPPSAGAPIGTDNIRLKIRLERGGDRFTGTFASNIRNMEGAVVFTARGTISGERIEV